MIHNSYFTKALHLILSSRSYVPEQIDLKDILRLTTSQAVHLSSRQKACHNIMFSLFYIQLCIYALGGSFWQSLVKFWLKKYQLLFKLLHLYTLMFTIYCYSNTLFTKYSHIYLTTNDTYLEQNFL